MFQISVIMKATSDDDKPIPGFLYQEICNILSPIKDQLDLQARSVTSPTADPGIASLIRSWSHTFMEIDHEIISMVILLLPLVDKKGCFQVHARSSS